MSEGLIKQVSELSQNVTVLNAQLQAHKSIINELMEASVNLRTNLSLHQNANSELTKLKEKKDKEIESLKKEIESLRFSNEELKADAVVEDSIAA